MRFTKFFFISCLILIFAACSQTTPEDKSDDTETEVKDDTLNKVGIRFINDFKTVAIKEGVILIEILQYRSDVPGTNLNMSIPFVVYSGIYDNSVTGTYKYFDPGEDVDFCIKCTVSYPKSSDPDRVDTAWYNFGKDFSAGERYKLEMSSADSLILSKLTKE